MSDGRINLRDLSKSQLDVTPGCSYDAVNAGSLQRIADSSERMAENYARIINDRDRFQRQYQQEQAESGRLARSNAALRGILKRMKGQSKHATT